jgi:agmatine deiminase
MKEGCRRLPAEWEPHAGILLCYPHNGRDWPGKYGAIQWAFIEFIKKISLFEKVFLMVADEKLEERVTDRLEDAQVSMSRIRFIIHKTNRSWMRDSGPVIVEGPDGQEALNFNFNGWAKYNNYRHDRKVPEVVARELKLPSTQVRFKGKPVVLEGGAIDSNGSGSLLTSEECLLHPHIQVRNNGFSREDYENIFLEYLGVSNVIWLGDGIEGDDTHGHIDDLCRFVSKNRIVAVIESNRNSVNYKPLQLNLERLHKATLENGKSPEIITLPMPETITFEGINLPASYANFLILNGCVLVPTFNDVHDREALTVLAGCYPGRKIIGISAIDLIWGFGTLHCLSQQIPAKTLK